MLSDYESIKELTHWLGQSPPVLVVLEHLVGAFLSKVDNILLLSITFRACYGSHFSNCLFFFWETFLQLSNLSDTFCIRLETPSSSFRFQAETVLWLLTIVVSIDSSDKGPRKSTGSGDSDRKEKASCDHTRIFWIFWFVWLLLCFVLRTKEGAEVIFKQKTWAEGQLSGATVSQHMRIPEFNPQHYN